MSNKYEERQKKLVKKQKAKEDSLTKLQRKFADRPRTLSSTNKISENMADDLRAKNKKKKSSAKDSLRTKQSVYDYDEKKAQAEKKSSEKKKQNAEKNRKTKESLKKQADWAIRSVKSDFLPTEERQKVQNQIAKEKAEDYQKKGGFANDKIGQAYAGFGEAVIDASPVGIAYSIAKGKKLSDSDLTKKGKKDSVLDVEPTEEGKKARKAGKIAGEMLSYASAYGAAGKATSKAAAKALSTKTGKKAVEKAAASKAGKKVGEETVKKAAKEITKDAIADATVGTAMDYGLGKGEGLEGKELAEYMGKNALLNIGIGGAVDLAPVALRAVSKKAGKNTLRTATKEAEEAVDNAPKTAKTASESVEKAVNTELPTKATKEAESGKKTVDLPATSNKRLTSNDEAEYLSTGNDKAKYLKTKRSDYKGKKVLTSEEIPNYVEDSINGVVQNDIKPYGKVGNRLSEEVKALSGGNVDIGNYHLELSSDDLRHAYKNHSTAKQAGNLPLSLEDFKKAVDYVDNYDDVLEVIPTKKGTRILLGKQINGHSVITEIVSEPSKSLRLKNMWKLDTDTYLSRYNGVIKEKAPMLTTSQPKNGETYYQPSDMLSTQSISDSVENVKLKDLGADTAKNTSDIPQFLKQEQPEIKVNSKGEEVKVADFDVEGDKTVGIVSPGTQDFQEAIEHASGTFDRLYKAFVNSTHEIDKLSKAAGDNRAVNSVQAVKTANGTSDYIFKKHLVNPKGEVIDDRSFIDVFKPISDNSEAFNEYAQHLNNIDRWKQDKPLDRNVTAEDSINRVNELVQEHPEFPQLTQNLNSWWNKVTHAWLVDTGRMTENAWQAMTTKYPNYVPAFMPDKGVKIGGSRFSINSGTKAAKAGNTLKRIPIEDAMMQQVQQMVKTTRKNDLYLNVIDTLRNNPEELKRFGVVSSDRQVLDNLDFDTILSNSEKESLKEVNSKLYTISAMENGEKVTAYISADLAEAFAKIDNVIGSKNMQAFANIGKKLTNAMKSVITVYNPVFSLANLSRDIPSALIQTQNGTMPFTKNMFKAVEQMATNGEMWNKYLALGGKTSGYVGSNRTFRNTLVPTKNPIKNVFDGIKNVLGAAGEVTESIPRFAEFLSTMERTGNIDEALRDSARVTTDFSNAGEVGKTLDAWTLYLNAGIQGLDTFAKTIKAHPLRTAARSASVITVPYALLTLYNWSNPHYQDLTDHTKQNYFILPNLAGETDDEGNAKTFIKIPLNREYGAIFGSALDVVAGYASGEVDPWNGYANTIKNNFMAADPASENILAPLLINLPNNVNYAGSKIVPTNLQKVSPELQYDSSTSGLAKGISKVASNLKIPSETLRSPMKVDYLLDSYTGYYGQVGQALTDQSLQGTGERVKGATIDPFIDRFTADPRYSSGVVSDFYNAKEEAEKAYNDIRLTNGDKGQEYVVNKAYTAIQDELSELSKEEKSILADNTLTAKEKAEKSKEIREQRNEIARGAAARVEDAIAEYKQNPNYAVLDASQKESYEKKYKDLGVSKEDYAVAKQIISDTDAETNAAKAYALLENGQSVDLAIAMTSEKAVEEASEYKKNGVTYDEIQKANQIVKDSGYSKSVGKAYALLSNGTSEGVATMMTSERAVKNATRCKQAGVTPEVLDKVASYIDTNGNGSYTKDEIMAFFDANGAEFTRVQKAAIFMSLNTSKYNPYY